MFKTGRSSLRRYAVINLAASLAPLVVALIAVPVLMQGLGATKFGVLVLSWLVLGYFSIFDLGIGQALTREVAHCADGDFVGVHRAIVTGITLMAAIGMVVMVVLLFASSFLVVHVLAVPADLHSEAANALRTMAIGVPFVIMSSGYRGVLEAFHRFDLVASIRIPLSIVNYVVPIALMNVGASLDEMLLGLVFARIVLWVFFLCAVRYVAGLVWKAELMSRRTAKSLATFGGWLSVSTVISPLLVQLDRFVLASAGSMTALAHYAASYEVITKALMLPGVLASTIFPRVTRDAKEDVRSLFTLLSSAQRVLFAAIFPICAIGCAFAEDLLRLWLRSQFSMEGARVMEILSIGVMANAVAVLPSMTIQAKGEPRVTAKIHLVELPIYVPILIFLTAGWGAAGAAMSWTLRACFDCIAVLVALGAVESKLKQISWKSGAYTLAGACVLISLGLIPSFTIRCLIVGAIVAWASFSVRGFLDLRNKTSAAK